MGAQGIITLNIDGEDMEARQGQTILEVARDAGIYIPSLCYYPGLKPLPQVIPDEACQLCIWEERASLANGNVPWIASHIIKKLNLTNNEASFASFGLMRRMVTISISQLKRAWERIIKSKGETIWNMRYRKSYPLIKEPRVS